MGFYLENSCHRDIRNVTGESLANWQPVKDTGIPGWDKELLPEEEIERPADWKPPTPPKVDKGLMQYVEEFKKDEEPELPKITDKFSSKEEILRKDLADDDEVVLYNSEYMIRTTIAGIKKSKWEREDEETREERMSGGGGRDDVGGSGGGQCHTYAEYKAMKAAKAAAPGN